MSEQTPSGAFTVGYETVCDACDDVIYVGELGKYNSNDYVVHFRCPQRQPPLCLECFLLHNGECP